MAVLESSNRRAALAASLLAAFLIVCAVTVHHHAVAPETLLQTQEGLARHLEALKELGEKTVLSEMERQAFEHGFLAGEKTAEKDVAEDDAGSLSSKDAMLEKQAMLKHMLAANKLIKEQNQLAEDAELEKQAMYQHMMAANENLQQEDRKEQALMTKAVELHAERMDKIAAEEKAEDAFGKKLAEQQEAIKQAAETRLLSKKIGAQPTEQAQPGSEQAFKLMSLCTRMFGDDEDLQRFCYDRMVEGTPKLEGAEDASNMEDAMVDPHGEAQLTIVHPEDGQQVFAVEPVAPFDPLHSHPPQSLMRAAARVRSATQGDDVEVTAGSLAASIKDAHEMGFKGSPKAIVYHKADGEEDVYKKAAPGQGGQMLAEDPSAITVDGPTFKASVDRAHAMGLQGSPEAVVYHPAYGAAQTYQLAGEYNVDVPTRTRHAHM